MNVQQVKQITREWLANNLAEYPGLRGAHFVGSINSMLEEADFPSYKDVDFHLIFQPGSPTLENPGPFMNILETHYRGVILEGGYKPISDYQTPEAVLGNPEIAHHLTVDSVIYDPDGWLQNLQKSIRQGYARRHWVQARIEYECHMMERWREIRSHAQAMDPSGLTEFSLLGYHLTFLTALLCIATLQSPSSALDRLRGILVEYNRRDLYDEAMAILGLQGCSVDQLKQMLEEGAEAFDLAVRVKKTSFPFQHKLNAHQRGYFVDKCRSLMDAGMIEEAMAWALTFYGGSISVILVDGPEEIRPTYLNRKKRLVDMVNMATPESRDERFSRMLKLDEQFFKLAETMVQSNPSIVD